MENNFGKYFSAQSHDEWRAVKLTNWGKSPTAKKWRTFQQQFETVVDRVIDKEETRSVRFTVRSNFGVLARKGVEVSKNAKMQHILPPFWYRSSL
jgi:hypothetical protein